MNPQKEIDFVHVELKKDTWARPALRANSSSEAIDAIRSMIRNLDREVVVQLNLTTKWRVINASVVSIGNINTSIVDPPEIMRTALLSGAPHFILLHNHPSGDCTPSIDDRKVAKRLSSAAKLIGLELVDFIIVGEGEYYSMSEVDRESLEPVMMAAE